MYELIRILLKRVVIPFLDLPVRISPRSLRVFLFASIADSLSLKNVRFDVPMALRIDSDKRDQTLNLGLFPNDRSVIPSILISGQWELSEPRFVAEHISSGTSYVLFDVGANFGLFSLQLLKLLKDRVPQPAIRKIFLFEPDPSIAPILRGNMSQAIDQGIEIEVVEKAVGKQPGRAIFYLDDTNKANNSLAKRAMERAAGSVSERTVDVLGPDDLLAMLPELESERVIYKSDLQGINPDIVASIPKSFWERVDVMIIELWPQVLRDYQFSTNDFKAVPRQFGTILIEDRGSIRPINVEEVAGIISSVEDHRYFNLLCRR